MKRILDFFADTVFDIIQESIWYLVRICGTDPSYLLEYSQLLIQE